MVNESWNEKCTLSSIGLRMALNVGDLCMYIYEAQFDKLNNAIIK